MTQPVRPPLTAHEIEDRIIATLDHLDETVEDYAEIAERAGLADVELKRRQASTLLAVIESPPRDSDGRPRKITAAERDALVELNITDYRKDAAIAAAARETAREAMNTHRVRLEALRTLAANVRVVTSPRHGDGR